MMARYIVPLSLAFAAMTVTTLAASTERTNEVGQRKLGSIRYETYGGQYMKDTMETIGHGEGKGGKGGKGGKEKGSKKDKDYMKDKKMEDKYYDKEKEEKAGKEKEPKTDKKKKEKEYTKDKEMKGKYDNKDKQDKGMKGGKGGKEKEPIVEKKDKYPKDKDSKDKEAKDKVSKDKVPKEPKDPKDPKEPKDKVAKEPKDTKEPKDKEPKDTKEPKEKESKGEGDKETISDDKTMHGGDVVMPQPPPEEDCCPYNNYVDDVCVSARDIADAAVQAIFVDFDNVTTAKLLAPSYIQHNPFFPTGAQAIIDLLPAIEASGMGLETHRTIVDGNLVAYHNTYTNADLFGFGPTIVTFDVFRVEDGLVQEHWDNIQPKPNTTNPSGHTMTDGETTVSIFDGRRNYNLVLDFLHTVFINEDFSNVEKYLSQDEYIQHNPSFPDGYDTFVEGLSPALQNDYIVYDAIKLIISQGNFVLVASEGLMEGTPYAFYDLLRVEDHLIVEHWDVLQEIPPPEAFVHDNGKF